MSETLDIAVICGGPSPEADISRRSGNAVAAALEQKGHQVRVVEADAHGLLALAEKPPECAWLATHGPHGEDGTLQGFFEVLGIPYTGSGVTASAAAMDKILTRRIMRTSSLRQPKWFQVNLANVDSCTLPDQWSYPVFVKPSVGGSSLGANIANAQPELVDRVYQALQYHDIAIVEPRLVGRELSVAVFEGAVLGDIEIIPAGDFFSHADKYEKETTQYIMQPDILEDVRRELHEQALEAASILGCEGAIRIDFFLVGERELYFMEINTIPGLQETSLLPKIAAQVGISFSDLVERIVWQARLKCTY